MPRLVCWIGRILLLQIIESLLSIFLRVNSWSTPFFLSSHFEAAKQRTIIQMAFTKMQVTSLGHVHYQHPDLEMSLGCFEDFGLIEEDRQPTKAFLRGINNQPYLYIAEQSPDNNRHFIRAYWNISSYEDYKGQLSLMFKDRR